MEQLRQRKKLKLYKALKAGYLRDERKQAKVLKRFGYRLDKELSNGREYLTAYNPFDNKLLFISNGTDATSPKDLYEDLRYLSIGDTKSSDRYNNEKNALLKAKKKYEGAQTTLTGHSLGANHIHYLGSQDDNIISYNPYLPPNYKDRPNETLIRTRGDLISGFARNPEITLPNNPNIGAHYVENLRNSPIYI